MTRRCRLETKDTNCRAILKRLKQAVDNRCRHQRCVAIQDYNIALEARQSILSCLHGMACAKRLRLHGNGICAESRLDMGAKFFAVRADDDNYSLAFKPPGQVNRPVEHRPAANLMQHFGTGGLHPGPLSGCQYDCGPLAHAPLSSPCLRISTRP